MSTPAAALLTCIVRPGREQAFARWLDAVEGDAAAQAGFRQSLRLEQAGGQVHLLTLFDDPQQLHAWRASARARGLHDDGEGLAALKEAWESGPHIRFPVPSEASAAPWRRFLVTWAAVFPTLLALNGLLQLLPFDLPLFARLAISSPLLTATLTWIILPRVNRWTRTWRLTDAEGRPSAPD